MKARLNPTANGDVHIGHIYNAYVNRAMSDELDIRFDDNQAHWVSRLGQEKINSFIDRQITDFDWMGLRFENIYTNSDLEYVVTKVMARSPHWRMIPDAIGYGENAFPMIVDDTGIPVFGATFYLTAEKVIQDNHMGTGCLVRGTELLGEDHLYSYFCGIFGYQVPRKYYIPRLTTGDKKELTGISKTAGNWKVRDLREKGVSTDQIHEVLRRACLKDPLGSWRVENIKAFPALDVEEI